MRSKSLRFSVFRGRLYNVPVKPRVGIIMGSTSDWDTLKYAAEMLERLGVPHEVRVVSAHRTPDLLFDYASTARERGLEVIIAGAGGAAHLPGMCAAKTSLPVLGVPVQSQGAERARLAALDRADARWHPGRHARDRRGRRDQRRAAGCIDPCQRGRQDSRSASMLTAPHRPTRSSPNPTLATRQSQREDRHHRCGPARTHAGPRGLSAGTAVPLSRRQRGFARRPGRTDHHGCVRRSAQPRAAGSRCRPGHLRIRERARGRAAEGGGNASRVAAGRRTARVAGSPAREAAVLAR